MEAKQCTAKYQEITEEIKEEILKYLESNGNKNTTTQKLWDTAKTVLRGKFIAIQAHLKKQENLKQSIFTLKATRKRTEKTQSQ